MTDNAMILTANSGLMPALSIQSAVARYNAVLEFTKTVMKDGKDFGVVPGTDKPTLLKPGAEKLCSLFDLYPKFNAVDKIVDFDRGLFYFQYECVLHRNGNPVASGLGSCNSKEKKYRYRSAERKCPNCGKPAIIKGKAEYGGGWLCFNKKGGCGAKFTDTDPAIIDQQVGQIENTEPFDLINTIDKMAQKRALVAATLIGANASEFFTQDVEDMDYIEGKYTEVAVPAAPAQPQKPANHVTKPLPSETEFFFDTPQDEQTTGAAANPVQALVEAGISENSSAASSLLNKYYMPAHPGPVDNVKLVAWGKMYRAWRDADPKLEPKTAAERATAGLVPQ